MKRMRAPLDFRADPVKSLFEPCGSTESFILLRMYSKSLTGLEGSEWPSDRKGRATTPWTPRASLTACREDGQAWPDALNKASNQFSYSTCFPFLSGMVDLLHVSSSPLSSLSLRLRHPFMRRSGKSTRTNAPSNFVSATKKYEATSGSYRSPPLGGANAPSVQTMLFVQCQTCLMIGSTSDVANTFGATVHKNTFFIYHVNVMIPRLASLEPPGSWLLAPRARPQP
ncbi:hypothetical protein BGZ63DRAFT_13039 [Mariannaea sp. PMI_226]|nr:hypothetical protein BGZ63DRAFT_13039 [Mariannaea sp. PMI_226]